MDDLIEILGTGYFTWGLVFGVASLLAGWGYLAVGRPVAPGRRRPLALGGWLITASSLAALFLAGEELGEVLFGLGLLAVGVGSVRLFGAPSIAAVFASFPGALILSFSVPDEPVWARLVMILMVPLGGRLIVEFEERYSSWGIGVVFYSLAVMGTFLAVPDTELARTLLAVCLPITLLAWPQANVSLGPEGAYLAVALFVWVTVSGGVDRPASIVGATACLGFLLVEPLLTRLREETGDLSSVLSVEPAGVVLASLPQFVLMVVCSRFAARFTDVTPALLVVSAVWLLASWFLDRIRHSLSAA